MPDDGASLERVFLGSFLTRDEKRRIEAGLPAHVKCDCDYCVKWRSVNGHKIEGLDWGMKPKPKEPAVNLESLGKALVAAQARPMKTPVASGGRRVRY